MMPVHLTREQAYNNTVCNTLDEHVKGPWNKELAFRGIRLVPTGIAGSYEIRFYETDLGAVDCNDDGTIQGVTIHATTTDHLCGCLDPWSLQAVDELRGQPLFK